MVMGSRGLATSSSSIAGGSAFKILTYPWGMTEQSLRLIALAGQGRAETNGSRRAGVLFLGCPQVSVGQEVGYTTVRRKTVRSATVRRETVRRATIRRGPFSPQGPVRRLTITPLAA